jgi:hypothetical protein
MGFGPIAGAGRDEMLVRRSTDGMFGVYAITNNQFSFNFMSAVGTDWQFNGIAGHTAGVASGSSDSQLTDSTSQLVQAMAGFSGGSGAVDSLNAVSISADPSQQQLLTAPQHA